MKTILSSHMKDQEKLAYVCINGTRKNENFSSETAFQILQEWLSYTLTKSKNTLTSLVKYNVVREVETDIYQLNHDKESYSLPKKKVAPRTFKEQNPKYLEMSEKLKVIVQESYDIHIDGDALNTWARCFKLLLEKDKAKEEEVNQVLEWYRVELRDNRSQYTLIVLSGKTFREKYLKMINAMNRDKTRFKNKDMDVGSTAKANIVANTLRKKETWK